MASNAEFRQSVIRARLAQVRTMREYDRHFVAVLKRTAKQCTERLGALQEAAQGTGTIMTERYLAGILADVDRIASEYGEDVRKTMNLGMLKTSQNMADRELKIIDSMLEGNARENARAGLAANMKLTEKVEGVGEVSVAFGRVAEQALEATIRRIRTDGLTLSERLWELTGWTKRKMADLVEDSVAQGLSAKKLAKNLERFLTSTGEANARYNTMRMARTERMTAAREGHRLSAMNLDGTLKQHIECLGWRLSDAHKVPDRCDVWASEDSGLGAGNYMPDSLPIDHPNGFCYTISILKGIPDQFAIKEPKPEVYREGLNKREKAKVAAEDKERKRVEKKRLKDLRS